MPEVAKETLREWLTATLDNTRVRADGEVELASDNDLSNNDLRDFDPDDSPDGVEIGHPDPPEAWGLYLRKRDPHEEMARQNKRPLDLDEHWYDVEGAIEDGAPAPDESQLAKIAEPEFAPIIVVENRKGLKTGWYGLAYGWGVARPQRKRRTKPSDRTTIQLTGDRKHIVIPLDSVRVPEGVSYIWFALTRKQNNEADAKTADLFVVERVNVDASVPDEIVIKGLGKTHKAPEENTTSSGDAEQHEQPRYRYRRAEQNMRQFHCELSWFFITPFGHSAAQETTGDIWTARHQGKKQELRWQPRKRPPNATRWVPLARLAGDRWWQFRSRPFDEWCAISSDRPSEIEEEMERVNRPSLLKRKDRTGIGSPKRRLEGVTSEDVIPVPAGDYQAAHVFYDDDGKQSALSVFSEVIIGPDQGFRVRKPQVGVVIPNADHAVIDPDTGDPLDWFVDRSGGVQVVFPERGSMRYLDPSGSNSNLIFAATPWHDHYNPNNRFAVRFLLRGTRHVSGRVRGTIRFEDDTGGNRSDVDALTNISEVGKKEVHATIGPGGSGADAIAPSWATRWRILFTAVGNSASGVRNLDVLIENIGGLGGLGAPRTYSFEEDGWAEDGGEVAPNNYPAGGFARIIRNPEDDERPNALAGITMNSFEYWAPHGTPPGSDYGIWDYETLVFPGEQKTVSAWFQYRGVTEQTDALHAVLRDQDGEVVENLGYLFPNLSGSNFAGVRKSMTFTVPPDAASFQFNRGNLSDGFVRIMGFQMVDGASARAYTNEHFPSGTARAIFDTRADNIGVSSGLEILNLISRVHEAGVVFTDDGDRDTPGPTDVTYRIRTSEVGPPYAWSAWFDDWHDVPFGRYWQIEATLTTTNPLQTPELSWMGLRFSRPYGVLLDPRGREYPNGGVVVQRRKPFAKRRSRNEFISEDNTLDMRLRGKRIGRADGVNLLCFNFDTAERVMADQDDPKGLVVEIPLLGRRWRVLADEIDFDQVDDGFWRDPEAPRHHWQEYAADSVGMVLLGETSLSEEL